MPESPRERYEARLPLMETLRANLERETRDALADVEHIDRITFRVKGTDSFLAKAADPTNNPPYTDPLVEIEDQLAGRVIVFFLSDLTPTRQRLEETFNTIERSQRRPERDAEFGYESDHLISLIPPHLIPDGVTGRGDVPTTFELQIRTIFMHAYAEPQHSIQYKAPAELPREIRRELAWIAASAWGADRAYERVRRWSDGAA
jgi:putative GTP pyrophosphokinase